MGETPDKGTLDKIGDSIKELLGQTTVRAILAVGFGAITWYGFVNHMVSETNLIDLVKLIIIFFFTKEALQSENTST